MIPPFVREFPRRSSKEKGRSFRRALVSIYPDPSLERIAQRELDQPRHSLRTRDYAEIAGALDIGSHRVGKIDVVPNVEEVRGEPQILSLRQANVLDERKIPVLLEWPTINIPAQVAESR